MTTKMNQVLTLMALACLLGASAPAEVVLHRLYTDNMVLQRDKPVPVQGRAEAGEQVTVSFQGQKKSATADQDGRWTVELDPMPANKTGAELTVAGKNTVTLKNLLVGDVWLCSGQSNMAFPLGACNAPKDIETADFPALRAFTVPLICSERPEEDIVGKYDKLEWQVCSPQTAAGISAVAFYFGRRVQRETGVPVGLLVSSVGGTNIEKWIPYEAFRTEPLLVKIADTIDAAVVEYRRDLPGQLAKVEAWIPGAKSALAEDRVVPEMPEIPRHPIQPGSRWRGPWVHLYAGMIAPLKHFPVKGALWYQGESNGEELETYEAKMRALIGSWRKDWGYEFPFYFVQLANWLKPCEVPSGEDGQSKWMRVRQAQLKTLSVPQTGMAVTVDIGDAEDIHPKNKYDLGERLALWALAKDYGKKDLVYSGPLYKGMQAEGGKIRISFDCVGSGLMVGKKNGLDPAVEDKGGRLKRFAVAGADNQWRWADAVIDGGTVVVSSPEVPKPVAVRYAWAINPDGCNLYNREGLPASPFATDN